MPFVEDVTSTVAASTTAPFTKAPAGGSGVGSANSTMLFALRVAPNSICSHIVDVPFTLTMASICSVDNLSKDSRTVLSVGESQDSLFALCTLSEKSGRYQQQLNLNFSEGTEVVFKLEGDSKTAVDLTGVYNVYEDEEEIDGEEVMHAHEHGPNCSHDHSDESAEDDEELDYGELQGEFDYDDDSEDFSDEDSYDDSDDYEDISSDEEDAMNGGSETASDIVIHVGKLNDLPNGHQIKPVDTDGDEEMEEALSPAEVVEAESNDDDDDVEDEDDDEDDVEHDEDDDDDDEENDLDLMDFGDSEDDEDIMDPVDMQNGIDWDAMLAEDEAENAKRKESGEDEAPEGMGTVYGLATDYNLDDTEDLDLGEVGFNISELDELDDLDNLEDDSVSKKTNKNNKNNKKKANKKAKNTKTEPIIEEIDEKDTIKISKKKIVQPTEVVEETVDTDTKKITKNKDTTTFEEIATHAKKILKKPGNKKNSKSNKRVVFNEKVKVGVFQKPMKKKRNVRR